MGIDIDTKCPSCNELMFGDEHRYWIYVCQNPRCLKLGKNQTVYPEPDRGGDCG